MTTVIITQPTLFQASVGKIKSSKKNRKESNIAFLWEERKGRWGRKGERKVEITIILNHYMVY